MLIEYVKAGQAGAQPRGSKLQLGRGLFWFLAVGFVLLVPATLGQLPPVVASHFDGAGVPNGWSSRSAYGVLLVAVGLLLPVGIVGLVHMLTQRGPQLLNIPARDYWSHPEHRQEAVRRVRASMWWLGCIMAGTALTIHGLILEAHVGQPPRRPQRCATGVRSLDRGLVSTTAAANCRLSVPGVKRECSTSN